MAPRIQQARLPRLGGRAEGGGVDEVHVVITMPDDRDVISRIEGREEDDAEYLFDDFSDERAAIFED